MNKYAWWAVGLFLIGLWIDAAFAGPREFGFQSVIDQAQALSQKPFESGTPKDFPDFLKKISYDQWRDIRFKLSKTLWADDRRTLFKVRFFHPGFFYQQPVRINFVDASGVHPFIFSRGLFDYGKNDFGGKVPNDLGFAGFRLHYPINKKNYADEVAAFLGASYFRGIGRNELYGLSSRGLAVDTASNSGEEFPFFKEFWLVKPARGAKKMTLYGLLDSISLTGAYQFVILPGVSTSMRVRAVIFVRKPVEKLCVAVLTSMFLYGEDQLPSDHDDFRPEVHDSDGLLIASRTGEWIWRPLLNPTRLAVNTFEVGTPEGFGLLQRDLNFDHYQDLEANFQRRPSAWITPQGNWGGGHVELLQIPSNSEYNDNINAYWVPAQSPQAGQRLEFDYTLQWGPPDMPRERPAKTVATRWMHVDKDKIKFIVDFQGKNVDRLDAAQILTADITANQGYKIGESQVFKNKVTGGWRLVFQVYWDKSGAVKDLLPDKRPAMDLRAVLKQGQKTMTETWTYTLLP